MSRGLLAGLRAAGGVPVPVTVRICVPGGLDTLVHTPIAVVVHVVTDLGGARIHCGHCIVTVGVARHMARGLLAGRGGGGGVSVPIAVAVRVPGQRIQGVVLVRVPVAVVVGAIADLQASRVGCGCCVVAIIPVPGVPGRRCTGVGGGGGISVAIAVRIGVPGGLDPFVDIPIAVVVALITGLGSAGVAVGIQVVTVIACGDIPVGCLAGGGGELASAVPVAV